MNGPQIKGNPLKISVILLVVSYIVGDFVFPKYHLMYFIQLIGVLGLIFSVGVFIIGINLFKSHNEDPLPTSSTHRLLKISVFSYMRNPIYLSFVVFFLSMFLIFGNVMYFLSALGLSIWLHNWVIKSEEEYLQETFKDEYSQYTKSVKRWLLF